MKPIPEILHRVAQVVLAYRPADKKKKLTAKAKKVHSKKFKKRG